MRTLPLVRQTSWSNLDDPYQVTLNDWFWGANTMVVARGQYSNDQSTPIPVGGSTTSGVTSNVWLESDVYTGTPMSEQLTLSAENNIVGVAFNGSADSSAALRYLKSSVLPTSRRGSNLIYDAKNKRFVLFGGYDGTTRYNEVWELSADSAYHRWGKLYPSGTPATAKNLAAAVYVRGTTSGSVDKAYMVIWGGATPSDSNEMHSLDLTIPGHEVWTTITQTSAPATRSYLTHHMVSKVTASNTNDIYLFGGWGTTRTNDLQRCTFNVNTPTAVTWTTLVADGTTGNPSGRSGTGMIYDSVNDRLVITCGYDGTTYLSDTWQYSISGGVFAQLSPTGAIAGRELLSIGYDITNQRAIVMGGWFGTVTTNKNDAVQLSLASGSEAWTTIKTSDTSNQGVLAFSSGAAAVDTSRNMMVVATLNGYDSTNKYVYAFDMNDTSITSPIYSIGVTDYFRARDAPAYVYNSARGEMLLINGYSAMDDDTTIAHGEHISEIWAYDRTNNKWRYAAKGPYNMPQCEGGLAIYDSLNDRVIFFGGLTGAGQKSNDVWQLKADVHGMYKATKLKPTGVSPSARWLMAGCYDAANQRMVMWGGEGTLTVQNNLYSLDLTLGSESWSLLAASGTPPTAAWQSCYAYDATNSRLYIHAGGTNFADTTYTSQLFYLNTSTTNCAWTNTGVTGGLAVRGAVMGYDSTNHRLICFGGYDGSAVNNTVRYTSTTSFTSWTTQGTINVPSARRSAGCAIVGNYFLVSCGRPITGAWNNDLQELDTSVAPASWAWKSKSPDIYQMLSVPVSALTLSSQYHWQAWVTSNGSSGSAVSFGGNAESSPDFIISGSVGEIKVRIASAWSPKPVKVWNGSAWVIKPVKVWNGSAWVATTY